MDVQPYWNEDHTKYAVLVSVSYGAGWSTWNKRELAYDSRVVEFYLAHKDDEEWMNTVEESGLMSCEESAAHKEAREFFKSIGYDECPYMGGFDDIEIEWVPTGAFWRMAEYDGAEGIEYQDKQDWVCF